MTAWQAMPGLIAHEIRADIGQGALAQESRDTLRSAGVAFLAGWSRREGLAIYPRVAQALSTSIPSRQAFAAEVATAVAMALAESQTPAELYGQVKRHLPEVEEPPSDLVLGKLTHQAQQRVSTANLENFVMRQEALRLIDAPGVLAPREREVMHRVREGYLLREIADEFGIDIGSVKTTKHRAERKLARAFSE